MFARLNEFQSLGNTSSVGSLDMSVLHVLAVVVNVQLEGPLGRGLEHCMKNPGTSPSAMRLNPLIAITEVVNGAGNEMDFITPGEFKPDWGTMLEV